MNRAKNFIKLIEGHKPEISRYGKCLSGYKWNSYYKRCFPDDETNKEGHHEDLWPASKPGFLPGVSAMTQLVPEKKRDSNWVCPKCGFKDKANREEVLDAMCTCPKCGACMKEEK